jgi:hypothetical protein
MSVPGRGGAYFAVLGLILLVGATVGVSLSFGRQAGPTPLGARTAMGSPTTSTTVQPNLDLSRCEVPRTPGTTVPVPPTEPVPAGSVPALGSGWSLSSALIDPGTAGLSVTLDAAHAVIYDLLATAPLNEGPYALLKVNLDSERVTVGPDLPTIADLVVADGYLWAGWVISGAEGQPSPGIICQFDLTNVTLLRQITLTPEQTNWGLAMAPGPDGTSVLVGYGRSLLTVASSGGAEHRITAGLDGLSAFVAASPQGDVAYVTTQGDAEGVTQVVDEVDLASGAVVSRNDSQALGGVGPGAVTAVDNGVWLSWRTGMAGATVFLRRANLSLAPSPVDPHPVNTQGPGNLFSSIMGEGTTYADGVLWIVAGDGQLGCLDPSTGGVRAEVRLTQPEARLLGADSAGRLYVGYYASKSGLLLTLVAPPACFS